MENRRRSRNQKRRSRVETGREEKEIEQVKGASKDKEGKGIVI